MNPDYRRQRPAIPPDCSTVTVAIPRHVLGWLSAIAQRNNSTLRGTVQTLLAELMKEPAFIEALEQEHAFPVRKKYGRPLKRPLKTST